MNTDKLRGQWAALWERIGASGDANTAFDDVEKHYGEPHRYYHTLKHIKTVLEAFEELRDTAYDSAAVEMALWLHDVVYMPGNKNNEERSATYAQTLLEEADIDPATIERVAELILVTKHRESPQDPDAQIVVDCDFYPLGISSKDFESNTKNIRKEYQTVMPLSEQKEPGLLERLLEREHIYSSELFQEKYEKQARENLEKLLSFK